MLSPSASGYCNDPVMRNYRAYGFRGVVAKPYKLQDLQEALKNLLTEGV
jgi:two-component system, cell cycle sensor histidine kinase and response regulator CckA